LDIPHPSAFSGVTEFIAHDDGNYGQHTPVTLAINYPSALV
jgi:hypothetical protein